MLYRYIFSLISCYLTASAYGAEIPHLETHTVNGYKVILINTHEGNEATVAVNVDTGMRFDSPEQAGISHLLEHVMFLGSINFPHAETFDRISKEIGAETNAFTGSSQTYYYMTLNSSNIEQAIRLQGDRFHSLEWNAAAIEREKKVVMNEALSYMSQAGQALSDGPFMYLLPGTHFLAKFSIGTQDVLSKITLEDLRRYYEQHYSPSNVQIIISGNFDTPHAKIATILRVIKDAFHAPKTTLIEPLKVNRLLTPLPSIRMDEGGKIRSVEFGDTSESKSLQILFETVNSSSDYRQNIAIEILGDILSKKSSGSLYSVLYSKGWIKGFSAYGTPNGYVNYFTIGMELTETGAANRAAVIAEIMQYLAQVKNAGIEQATLDYFMKLNVQSYTSNTDTSSDFANLASSNHQKFVPDTALIDFPKLYSGLTTQDIRALANLMFQPEALLMSYVGSDVKSDQKDPVFGRPTIQSVHGLESEWVQALVKKDSNAAPISLQIPKLPIRYSEKPRGEGQQKPRMWGVRHRYVLEEKHSTNRGGMSLVWNFPPPSTVQSDLNLMIRLRSFQLHYQSELSEMASVGLIKELKIDSGRLSIVVSGNSQAAIDSMSWILQTWQQFRATDQEIQLAMESARSDFEDSYDEFPASQAVDAASQLTEKDLYSTKEKLKALKSFDRALYKAEESSVFDAGDFDVAAHGDFLSDDLEGIVRPYDISTRRLTQAEREASRQLLQMSTKNTFHRVPLPPRKPEGSYGLARVYTSMVPSLTEKAAIMVLASELSDAVYSLNRTERNLGYVHGFSPRVSQKGMRLYFFGETDKWEQRHLIQDGWEKTLEKVRERTLSADHFAGAIKGAIARLMTEETKDYERARDLLSRMRDGNPNSKEQLMDAIASLTEADIYAVADRYLLDRPYAEIVTSRKPVEGYKPMRTRQQRLPTTRALVDCPSNLKPKVRQ